MTLQAVKGGLYLPTPIILGGAPGIATSSNWVIDAADEKVGIVFQAPATGTISGFGWMHGVTTIGGADDVLIRLETVDGATGFPSGTLAGTNTNVSLDIANSDDNIWKEVALTAGHSTTKGDLLAFVLANPPANFGNMQPFSPWAASNAIHGAFVFPYTLAYTTSWAKKTVANGVPSFGVKYSGDVWHPIPKYLPIKATNTHNFSNASTPDVYALKFKVPWPCTISGFWAQLDPDGDCNIILYGSDGVTPLLTTAVDKDNRAETTSNIVYMEFPGTTDIVADTFYYLGVEASTATGLNAYSVDVDSAAVMDALEGGQNFHYATAKDPSGVGSWTAITTRRLLIGPYFSKFGDDTGGGGGGDMGLNQGIQALGTGIAA